MSDNEDIEQLRGEVNRLWELVEKLATKDDGTMYGWVNSAWQKQPLWGYSGDVTEQPFTLNAAAGTNTLTGSTVPAGEIWRVQLVEAYNSNSNPTAILLYAFVNGVNLDLKYQATPGTAVPVIWIGEITLSEGDAIKTDITGCTLNDDIVLKFHAVRVDIDQ